MIGLDTETYWDANTNGSYVSLVQLAAREGDVIVADEEHMAGDRHFRLILAGGIRYGGR